MNDKQVTYTVIAGYALSTGAILALVTLVLFGVQNYTNSVDQKLDLIDERVQRITVRLTETREHQRAIKEQVDPVIRDLEAVNDALNRDKIESFDDLEKELDGQQ